MTKLLVQTNLHVRTMLNCAFVKTRTSSSAFYFRKIAQHSMMNCNIKNKTVLKPPNIIVYCPGFDKHNEEIVDFVEQCLEESRYTVYSITPGRFNADPWMENAEALILFPSSSLNISQIQKIQASVKRYMLIGGKVLSFNSQLASHSSLTKSLPELSAEYKFILKKSAHSAFVTLPSKLWNGCAFNLENESSNKAYHSLINVEHGMNSCCVARHFGQNDAGIISLVSLLDMTAQGHSASRRLMMSYLLHCLGLKSKWQADDTVGEPDGLFHDNRKYNGYLFATDQHLQKDFLSRLGENLMPSSSVNVPGLRFVPLSSHQNEEEEDEHGAESEIKISYSDGSENPSKTQHSFDWETYKSCLTSDKYGRLVVYADVISTTMDVFDGICTKLATNSGPIAIARQQTKGQGRSTNKWLSPTGCAMFTLVVHIPVYSHLGSRLPFIQHITSVAVVHAIRSIPGLEDVDLRVKWPNDIYHGTTTKLGGVIVKSSIFRNMCIASIGCGINVSNNKPTACVNDVMSEEYLISRALKCEEVIARTVSSLEELVEEFQRSGPESFLKLYYKYWIHSAAEVAIELDGVMVDSTIVGVDDCGFLRARRHDNGVVVSLQPDGNTFDIMRNLIVSKKRY